MGFLPLADAVKTDINELGDVCLVQGMIQTQNGLYIEPVRFKEAEGQGGVPLEIGQGPSGPEGVLGLERLFRPQRKLQIGGGRDDQPGQFAPGKPRDVPGIDSAT